MKKPREEHVEHLPAPVFLVGAARSGTTLLQYMLRSHPNLSAPTGESHFIIPLHRVAHSYVDLRDSLIVRQVIDRMRQISREFMEEDLHGIERDWDTLSEALAARHDGTMHSLIRALFELNAEGEGKRRWVDKTPYYVLHIPTLATLYPDAQFVHIIRDGRDCAVSMLGRARDLRIFNVYHAAQVWAQYVDAGQRAGAELGLGRYHELRYEDLLGDPEATLRRLCDFLGEPFDKRLIDFKRSADSGNRTPLLRQPLQSENREKWRTRMTQWQIRVFESEAGETLARNGYSLAGNRSGRLPKPLRAVYRLHLMASDRFLVKRNAA